MLREPAGEMDLENGFTGGPKKANYTLYCAVSGVTNPARRFTAYTFHAIAHPKMQTKTQRGAGRQKSAEDKNSKISDRQLVPRDPQNRRPHIGFSTLPTKPQDEECKLAAHTSTSTLDRMQFPTQTVANHYIWRVYAEMGLVLTPTPLGPKKGILGSKRGDFRGRVPLFAPVWPCFGPKLGQFRPNFGSVGAPGG